MQETSVINQSWSIFPDQALVFLMTEYLVKQYFLTSLYGLGQVEENLFIEHNPRWTHYQWISMWQKCYTRLLRVSPATKILIRRDQLTWFIRKQGRYPSNAVEFQHAVYSIQVSIYTEVYYKIIRQDWDYLITQMGIKASEYHTRGIQLLANLTPCQQTLVTAFPGRQNRPEQCRHCALVRDCKEAIVEFLYGDWGRTFMPSEISSKVRIETIEELRVRLHHLRRKTLTRREMRCARFQREYVLL